MNVEGNKRSGIKSERGTRNMGKIWIGKGGVTKVFKVFKTLVDI